MEPSETSQPTTRGSILGDTSHSSTVDAAKRHHVENSHPGGNVYSLLIHKRRFRRGVACAALLICSLSVVGSMFAARWALEKTKEVPDFYIQAKARTPVDLDAVSRQLEHEVQEFTDQVGLIGSWHAMFTEEQINAWLVQQLPKEFSKVLPRGVQDPRVVIQDGKVLAAARYADHRIDTVVSFEIEIQLTEVPNVLAVEIRNLKAGALPLPLNHFVHQISRRAAYDSLEVRWDEGDEGIPIGLITVPSEHPKYVRAPVIVESVELTDGRLWLSGHTGPEAVMSFQPRGPVYQLASLRTNEGDSSKRKADKFSSRL